jgi:hypothetical protein
VNQNWTNPSGTPITREPVPMGARPRYTGQPNGGLVVLNDQIAFVQKLLPLRSTRAEARRVTSRGEQSGTGGNS